MPFGDQRQGIGTLGTLVVGCLVVRPFTQDFARRRYGDRVSGRHARAGGEQVLDEDQRRRLAHVIGTGFEGQPPYGDLATVKVAAKMFEQALGQVVFLLLIDRLHRGQNSQARARLLGGVEHCAQILGKAASPEPRPGVEELVADARVRAKSLAHQLDVGTHCIAQACQLVHERDARRQHGIGGILGQLGRAAIHHQDAIA